MINESEPTDWKDLQVQVARILSECGMATEIEKDIQTARETVNVDVWAQDTEHEPSVTYLCECKHWAAAVPKAVIHSFRTVVTDYGANFGLIISSSGFQSGATPAASYTNVRLLNWREFESIFERRWITRHLMPTLERETSALVEYIEPINSRIFRKADRLSEDRRERFKELREQHQRFGNLALALYLPISTIRDKQIPLPLVSPSEDVEDRYDRPLPEDVARATSYRVLLDAMCRAAREATAEFDAVFGERA